MFIHNLSHGGFGLVKDLWHEEQENKNHRGLISKCKASIFGLGICSHLPVNIVIFDCYNNRLNQLFYFKNINTVELKPGKIILWIVVRLYILSSSSRRNSISCVSAKLSDLIYPVDIFTTLVPVVTKNDSFSDWAFYQLIKQ